MATVREVDKWRKQAEDNMALAMRVLSALMWAAKELVSLQSIHVADDFSHCVICKVEFPCPTAERIKSMAQVFDRAQREAPNGDA
jgi:hypothetical protein